jgi:hypothetical protein
MCCPGQGSIIIIKPEGDCRATTAITEILLPEDRPAILATHANVIPFSRPADPVTCTAVYGHAVVTKRISRTTARRSHRSRHRNGKP